MALRDVHGAFAEEDPDLGELTTDECAAIRAAAAAEGYSETFADLLCRFAELIGAEQVLLELKQIKEQLKDEGPS